jgi:hypothetical protein
MTRKARLAFTAPAGSILQVKMRLLDINPMIWRRVLVPIASTLQELRGVIQDAMGWEGLHLHEFRVRSARYGSPELCAGPADVTLESLRFRRNAKLVYVDDMGDWWAHEVRVEDRLAAEEGKRYPICVGGQGACPPEDCGGPEGYQARREEALGVEALDDLDTIEGCFDPPEGMTAKLPGASLLKEIVRDGRHALLDDEDQRWKLEGALERLQARQPFLADGFARREVNARFRDGEHRRLMHQGC